MDWPPTNHRRQQKQSHQKQSAFKQSYRPSGRAPPPPLPDLIQPILITLAVVFLVSALAFFGPPIELELAYRRLSRWARRMGLLSWWNGPRSNDSQGSSELARQQPTQRRRRGGDLNKQGEWSARTLDKSRSEKLTSSRCPRRSVQLSLLRKSTVRWMGPVTSRDSSTLQEPSASSTRSSRSVPDIIPDGGTTPRVRLVSSS